MRSIHYSMNVVNKRKKSNERSNFQSTDKQTNSHLQQLALFKIDLTMKKQYYKENERKLMITKKLKQKINDHSFEWDREERLAKSMEDIFRLVG